MIAIGVQLGGPEQKDSSIHRALSSAMRTASTSRSLNYDDVTEAWINPIFIVPGSIWGTDFQGYKLGHYSKKQKGLVVMIAVPFEVADGRGIPQFVVGALREAVRLAAAHFSLKGVDFSTSAAEMIITQIEAALIGLAG